MEDNLSRKAVLVLVVLGVVVSILSTSIVMNAIYDAELAPISSGGAPFQGAKAQMYVDSPPMVSGKVVLNVKNVGE